MNLGKVDLHTHSSFSDGLLAPAALVNLASEAGIAVLALTDHDTIDGLPEARQAAQTVGLELIPGVELTVHCMDIEFHLLAYDFDVRDSALSSHLANARERRTERARQIVARLRKRGLAITMDEVERLAAGAPPTRSHIASALVASRAVATRVAAFSDYLADGASEFVSVGAGDAEEAIRVVHAAGGWVSLAHPGHHTAHRTVLDLIELDMDALEAIHPSHDESLTAYYRTLAARHGIGVTGGSDFHGHIPEDRERLGRYSVDLEPLEAWKRDRGLGV